MENEATDGSDLCQVFELDKDGQPLCINEYVTWIAEDKNTHAIQCND